MDEVKRVYGSLDNAAIVTLAPELPGAVDMIQQLTSLGVVVSLGISAHVIASPLLFGPYQIIWRF